MLMLYWKKLNFDLKTPSPGSGEVGEDQLPGLGRMYARDGVVTLRESPSTISSLVSLLVLISRLPTNELRVATNA